MYSDGIKSRLNYQEMGKLMINLKLLNSNILLLKYKKSYAPVPKLKRMSISNDVKNILYYILDTNNINYENIRELKPTDNELIQKILNASGLDVVFRIDKSKLTENINDVVERFKIIQGELSAGNDNVEALLLEAKKLLPTLKKHERISNDEYIEIMKEINEQLDSS